MKPSNFDVKSPVAASALAPSHASRGKERIRRDGKYAIFCLIPPELVGLVIGARGAQIKAVETGSGTQIGLAKGNETVMGYPRRRLVISSGQTERNSAALAHILKIMTDRISNREEGPFRGKWDSKQRTTQRDSVSLRVLPPPTLSLPRHSHLAATCGGEVRAERHGERRVEYHVRPASKLGQP